jgi:hypothetical protein
MTAGTVVGKLQRVDASIEGLLEIEAVVLQ